MAIREGSALARLRAHYEDHERTCPECGHRADRGGWRARAAPGEVRFRRPCPACGAVDVRVLRHDRG